MRRLPRILLRSLLAACLLFGVVVPVLSQGLGGTGWRHFSETGHNVQGEFLAFFDGHGGVATLGLPRTEEYYQDGLQVQYFQRARMELHPNNPPAYRVQLTLLGDLLGYRAPPIPTSAIPEMNHPQRRYYPQTGHTLSYAFMQYYDSHGGLDVFGYPITELVTEGNTVVQYFQRAKMEWHPEQPIPNQITLGDVGDQYIARTNVPWSRLAPVAQPSSPGTEGAQMPNPTAVPMSPGAYQGPLPTPAVTSFEGSASVRYPITGQGGSQTVYVRVVDERGGGVGGAAVEMVVHFRTGDELHTANRTDASGYTSLSFNIGYPPPGYTVIIDVRATAGGHTETTHTSFIPWW
jgi:hypothetical protein